MKNIKLIALIFLTMIFQNQISQVFAAESELKSEKIKNLFEKNTSASLSLLVTHKNNFEISGGGKINLPFLESCFYKNKEDYNFGVLLSNKCMNQKVCINAGFGEFSSSGIISKMNNPMISETVSPYSSVSKNTQNICINFPGSKSFSNPQACFFSAVYSDLQKKLQNGQISFFYIPDQKFFINLQSKFNMNSIKLEISLASGLIHNEENISDSWFSQDFLNKSDFYFSEAAHFCFLNQISINYKNFSSLETIYFYEELFGNSIIFLGKTENNLTLKKMTINFSALINNNRDVFLSASNKKLSDKIQTKIGFQNKKIFLLKNMKNPGLMKYGGTFYFDSPFYYSSRENLQQNEKIAAGIQWIGLKNQTSLAVQTDFLSKPLSLWQKIYLENINSTIKTTFIFEKIKISSSLKLQYKKNETDNQTSLSEKLILSVSFCKNPEIAITSNAGCSQKDFVYDSCNFNMSISAKFNLDKISIKINTYEYFEEMPFS